jgi:hypothetical protein
MAVMRYLLFAPLIPIAFLIYFAIRRFFPKADPQEIYLWLFITLIGSIFPAGILGVLFRFLEQRGVVAMPSFVLLWLVTRFVTLITVGVCFLRDDTLRR